MLLILCNVSLLETLFSILVFDFRRVCRFSVLCIYVCGFAAFTDAQYAAGMLRLAGSYRRRLL